MKKYILLSIIVFAGFFLASPARATTYSVPCSGGADIYSAAQGDINSASNGDIISIGSGSCSLSKPLAWTDKNITVQGAGIGQTNITLPPGSSGCNYLGGASAFCINMTKGTPGTSSAGTPVVKVSWRVTGMTFTGTTAADDDWINIISNNPTNIYTMGWRIDHIDVEVPNASQGFRPIMAVGLLWGLIDNVKMYTQGIGVEVRSIGNNEYGTLGCPGGANPDAQAMEGDYSWSLPLHLGSDEAVYIEDSTFTGTTNGMAVPDMYYGAAVVSRHNTYNNADFYGHTSNGQLGRGGSRKFEVYNNTFVGAGGNTPVYESAGLQGNGTGVIFNNTISGYAVNGISIANYRAVNMDMTGHYFGNCQSTWNGCNNTTATKHGYSYDGFIETSGWPCFDQPGRGSGLTLAQIAAGAVQPSVPILLWNNGTQSGCSTGGSCDNTSNQVYLNTACAGNCASGNSNPLSAYISTTAHINGDKDYCVGATMPTTCGTYASTYVPYVYPHPCQTNWPACSGGSTPTPTPQPDTTPPAAPTGLKVN